MKKLLTNSISDVAQLPIKKGTLDFLQNSYNEQIVRAAIFAMYGGNPFNSQPLVLYGCVDSGIPGVTANISEGWVLFQGELFRVPKTSFAIPVGQHISYAIATNYVTGATADPVTFTDGVARNVHQDQTITLFPSNASPFFAAFIRYSFKTAQPQATEILSGIAELSTQAEANAGVNDSTIMTPLKTAVVTDAKDAILQAQLDTINSAWQIQTDIADVVAFYSGSGSGVVSSSSIKYKIVGKTMTMVMTAIINNTLPGGAVGTYVEVAIPESKTSGIGFAFHCHAGVLLKNSSIEIPSYTTVFNGGSVIRISPTTGGQLNGTTTTVSCSLTLEIS